MSTPERINPFAAPRESRVRYGIAASGPPVDPNEVETARPAAEVILMWGDDVLNVTHVSPPRDIVLGDGGEYALGRDVLGADRLPIVLERGGQLTCVIPEGANGAITIGDASKSFADLEAEGRLSAYDALPGARLYPLPDDASARVEHRGLTFLVKRTAQGRAVGASGLRMKHTGWIGLSLAVHAVFLVLFYFMPPQSQALSIDGITAQDRLIAYMVEPPERTEDPLPEWSNAAGGQPGEEGARHDGDEGEAGDPEERRTRNRMGIQGDPDDPNPEMARERIREEMDSLVAIGAVRALLGSWNSPTSPYAADRAHGNDAISALGALMGDQLGANAGHGGLGMRGTGRGAGGMGEGTLGLGRLGTICGGCNGPGGRYGTSVGSLARRDSPGGPTVRPARAAIRGALSQEAIRRVVRRHLAEVRFCYEQGLQSNPSLEGRVAVTWIIGADGAVQNASLSSSELGSSRVEGCVVEAVRRWAFPAPDGGGIVGVTYPFVLQFGR